MAELVGSPYQNVYNLRGGVSQANVGSENLVINGGGHKLTVKTKVQSTENNGDNGNALLRGAKNLTVRNLNIVLPENQGTAFYNPDGITLDTVNISNGKRAIYFGVAATLDSTITGCTFKGQETHAIQCEGNSYVRNMTVTGSTFKNINVAENKIILFAWQKEFSSNVFENCTGMVRVAAATVNGNNFTGVTARFVDGSTTITGNKFSTVGLHKENATFDLSKNYWGGNEPKVGENITLTKTGAGYTLDDWYVDESCTTLSSDHHWGEWTAVTPATCTESVSRAHACTYGDAHTETETIPALGHNWGAWTVVTPATYTSAGLEQRVCAHDASHVETREIPQLVYDDSDDDDDAPVTTTPQTTTIEEEATPLAALPENLAEVTVAVVDAETGESVEVAVSELPNVFVDVAEDSYARDAIAYAAALGLMNGVGSDADGEATFAPTAATGDMLATIL